MTEKKTPQQRLAEIEEKQRKLAVQKKAILNSLRQQNRKARTKLLIETGAELELLFPKIKDMDIQQRREFIRKLYVPIAPKTS